MGMASTNCSNILQSFTLAPEIRTTKGVPFASTAMCLLVPNLPRSVGLGPTFWAASWVRRAPEAPPFSWRLWVRKAPPPMHCPHSPSPNPIGRGLPSHLKCVPATQPKRRLAANRAADASTSCHCRISSRQAGIPKESLFEAQTKCLSKPLGLRPAACLLSATADGKATGVGFSSRVRRKAAVSPCRQSLTAASGGSFVRDSKEIAGPWPCLRRCCS